MLKFYHHFVSPSSRLVWIALIEKQISCEIVSLPPEAPSVPIIEEDGVEIAEALAILDYIETRYPVPALLPEDAPSLAIVQMVEAAIAQLEPAVTALLDRARGENLPNQGIEHSLTFLEHQLGDKQYFGGDFIARSDIVAGVWVTILPQLGISLDPYPHLKAWAKRLTRRLSWTGTQMRHEATTQTTHKTFSPSQLAQV